MKRLSIFAIIGCLAFAALHHGAMGQDKDKVAEKDRIVGKWTGKFEMTGPSGNKESIPATVIFGAEDVTIELSGEKGKGVMKLSYKLSNEENPKAIDLIKGEEKKKLRGIYMFEGDVLKICWNANAEPRPKDFVGGGRVDARLLSLKRQK